MYCTSDILSSLPTCPLSVLHGPVDSFRHGSRSLLTSCLSVCPIGYHAVNGAHYHQHSDYGGGFVSPRGFDSSSRGGSPAFSFGSPKLFSNHLEWDDEFRVAGTVLLPHPSCLCCRYRCRKRGRCHTGIAASARCQVPGSPQDMAMLTVSVVGLSRYVPIYDWSALILSWLRHVSRKLLPVVHTESEKCKLSAPKVLQSSSWMTVCCAGSLGYSFHRSA